MLDRLAIEAGRIKPGALPLLGLFWNVWEDEGPSSLRHRSARILSKELKAGTSLEQERRQGTGVHPVDTSRHTAAEEHDARHREQSEHEAHVTEFRTMATVAYDEVAAVAQDADTEHQESE